MQPESRYSALAKDRTALERTLWGLVAVVCGLDGGLYVFWCRAYANLLALQVLRGTFLSPLTRIPSFLKVGGAYSIAAIGAALSAYVGWRLVARAAGNESLKWWHCAPVGAILASIPFLIDTIDSLTLDSGINAQGDSTHANWLFAFAMLLGLLGGGLFPAAFRRFRRNDQS